MEMIEIITFLINIQLNLPRPRSHWKTVSTTAGMSKPNVEKKIAPTKLITSSRFGKAAAIATVGRIIFSNILLTACLFLYIPTLIIT